MASDCEEYKYVRKDNTQNVVVANSDYCHVDSINILNHTTKRENIVRKLASEDEVVETGSSSKKDLEVSETKADITENKKKSWRKPT